MADIIVKNNADVNTNVSKPDPTPSAEKLAGSMSIEGLPSLDASEGGQVITSAPITKEPVAPKGPSAALADKAVADVAAAKVAEGTAAEGGDKSGTKTDEKPVGFAKYLKAPKAGEDKSKPAKGQADATEQFDYAGYSEAEVTNLKNMSRQSREWVANLHKEANELRKNKDGSYLQHPSAYTLSPEYQSLQEDATYAVKEATYWSEQLQNVKDGKDVIPLAGWNADGSPKFGAAVKPSDKVEEILRMNVNNAYNVARDMKGKLETFPTKFKTQYSNDVRAINAERAKRFPWTSEPSLLKHTMDVDGQEKSIEQIRSDFLSLFPPYMRQELGTNVAADMLVGLVLRDIENKDLQSKAGVVNTLKNEEELVEPTSKAKVQEAGKPKHGKVKTFSMEGMPT